MFYIFRKRRTVNKDIVEVGRNEVVEVFSEYTVNISLEGSRAIIESERYNIIFEKAELIYESRYLFISLRYTHTIEGGNNIQLSINNSLG